MKQSSALQVRKSDGVLLNQLWAYRETLSQLMADNPTRSDTYLQDCLLNIAVTQDELVSLGYVF